MKRSFFSYRRLLSPIVDVYRFYRDGFRSMTVGRTLWGIILVKLLIMFAILRAFFFPNYLNERFDTHEEKSRHVIEALTKPNR